MSNDDQQDPQAGLRPPSDFNPRTDTPLDFPDRDLGELTPDDYRTLGFISGLEVHQQLLTRGKLFCRCPGGRNVTRVDGEVLRHMRPTLSELGEYDGTALMEFKTRKEIVYLLERGSVCTYEMDDTPPFPIDEESVRIAIECSLLFNLDLVSELHVMRKQYLDGSIPTGFQRTAMVGLTGTIPFRVPELGIDRVLRIRQLSLEEDSCREVSDVGHRVTFRTDRLGMPLTETVTEPDLLTPYEVAAGGRLIAATIQASGKVRRGAGAARQDTNVSIAGSRRIELKGVPSHRMLPKLTHIEAYRQLNLLRIKAELLKRGVTAAMLTLPPQGLPWERSPLAISAGSVLKHCDYAPLHDALERGETVAALRLPGFGGLLKRRTQPGVTFARELSDRVRVIACLTARPFMIHSDVKDYGLTAIEWQKVRSALKADAGDALVVLWGNERDAGTAVREVFLRAIDALVGVPAETRQGFADGTNGFERILPGADRMYPDTDTPPLPIPDAWIEQSRATLATRPWERLARYRALGVDPKNAALLASSRWNTLFDALAPAEGLVARRLAAALNKRLPWLLRRKHAAVPAPERLRPLVAALAAGELLPWGFEQAFDTVVSQPDTAVDAVLASLRPRAGDAAEVDRLVASALQRAQDLPGRSHAALMHWAMGEVMATVAGRVDPRGIYARLDQALPGRDGGAA